MTDGGGQGVSETFHDEAMRLSRLLALVDMGQSGWLPDDLTHLWQHQLHSTLAADFTEAMGTTQETAARISALGAMAQWTFDQFLGHNAPPLEALKLVKDVAKIRREQAGFPSEIATALYYAVIAVALARHGERITELDEAACRRGFQWAGQLPWLDERTRRLMETVRSNLPTI
jgi:hypothetical protein